MAPTEPERDKAQRLADASGRLVVVYWGLPDDPEGCLMWSGTDACPEVDIDRPSAWQEVANRLARTSGFTDRFVPMTHRSPEPAKPLEPSEVNHPLKRRMPYH